MEPLLTAAQVSEITGLTEGTLANMRSKGTGPAFVRLTPRVIRYTEEDVQEFIRNSRRTSANEE
ncbi:hypothetical protein B7R21_09890 [Subtercola boreus]|uniref:Helix-turn-helix domain-containing protein n=1 Tax=Subtercola boreus TaxID=120213 RepID=A0A3E0VUX7_9MICO|nr:hypothetical protein B7R21_09890 [Subtercola boreus]